jgi:hypothetical protein
MRSQDGHLVCNARFNLDVSSSSPERRFSTMDLNEVIALLTMMADHVNEPPGNEQSGIDQPGE